MNSFFNEIGIYGPIILILFSWFLLWHFKNLVFVFKVGLVMNSILNSILKGIIQQPRPIYDAKKVHLLLTNGKPFFFQNGIPFDLFGMPSGHVQMSFFIITFLFLSLKQYNIFYICFPLVLLTSYQRYESRMHSFNQIFVGSIIGTLFANGMYFIARENFKGKVREKPDDFGPI